MFGLVYAYFGSWGVYVQNTLIGILIVVAILLVVYKSTMVGIPWIAGKMLKKCTKYVRKGKEVREREIKRTNLYASVFQNDSQKEEESPSPRSATPPPPPPPSSAQTGLRQRSVYSEVVEPETALVMSDYFDDTPRQPMEDNYSPPVGVGGGLPPSYDSNMVRELEFSSGEAPREVVYPRI